MGEVYEAIETQSGRRIALKILSHTLIDANAADRFLREGRAAAAVSHPNSVYVFGSHDINGVPAIAMELVSGGTLHDVVAREGPMAPSRAVDAVLQLITGLEAADARGVLHRDIKPSNCFVGADGVVKVGDYGLSVPTGGDFTRLTVAGTFLGTPAFASPEQVHGRQLDLRSDLYSVGATLYFLLTVRPPFVRDGAMHMLAAVLQDTPDSPRTIAPAVPEGLAHVVLRCLKKEPSARYATYADLREALAPFARQTLGVASLRARFVAGVVDALILAPVDFTVFATLQDSAPVMQALGGMAASLLAGTAYFSIFEGRWGASVGKRLVGIRVTDLDGNAPGVIRALRRSLVFAMLLTAPDPIARLAQLTTAAAVMVSFGLGFAAFAILFCTARSANGWRGVHELVSSTRTVRRTAVGDRLASSHSSPVAHNAHTLPSTARARVGGYVVEQRVWTSTEMALDLAMDEALQRSVWIHHVSGLTPYPRDARQKLGRETRLRWLASRRSAEDNWDASEAPEGLALHEAPWAVVRIWLLALGREIERALTEGTMPETISLRHVWVATNGSAKLLDFPSTTLSGTEPLYRITDVTGAQRFLHAVAMSALTQEDQHALPRAGSLLLRSLSLRGFDSLQALTATLRAATDTATAMSRMHRAISVALCAVFPLSMLIVVVTRISAERIIRDDPTLDRVEQRLSELRRLDMEQPQSASRSGYRYGYAAARLLGRRVPPAPAAERSADESRAFAIYIADQDAAVLADERTWSIFAGASASSAQDYRSLAMQARDMTAGASDEERRDAEKRAARILAHVEQHARSRPPLWLKQCESVAVMVVLMLALVGTISIVTTILGRRPLVLNLLDYELVARGGPVTRARAAWRAVLAWSPTLVGVGLLGVLGPTGGSLEWRVAIALFAIMMMIVGAAWTIWGQRGLHDRLARTWVVPS